MVDSKYALSECYRQGISDINLFLLVAPKSSLASLGKDFPSQPFPPSLNLLASGPLDLSAGQLSCFLPSSLLLSFPSARKFPHAECVEIFIVSFPSLHKLPQTDFPTLPLKQANHAQCILFYFIDF